MGMVSPHRAERPWQGQMEASTSEPAVKFDPACYLCPENARAGRTKNLQFTGTFVFDNDYAALRPNTPTGEGRDGDLLVAQAEKRNVPRGLFSTPGTT